MINPNEPDIFDAFREGSRHARLMEMYHFSGAAQFELDELTAKTAEWLVGRQVRIIEIKTDSKDRVKAPKRPIRRYAKADRMPIWTDPKERDEARFYNGGKGPYLPAYANRKRFGGTVEGIDFPTRSIVVRPRGLSRFFDRWWVEVIDEAGEPRVNVDIADRSNGILGGTILKWIKFSGLERRKKSLRG